MDYPKSAPGIGLVGGKFIDENVQTGQQGSLIPAAWGNAVTDEILAVIAGAGLIPNESAYDQLLEAIETLITSREPARTQATQAEMEAGTLDDVRSMSPLRVKQAIAALASTPFASSAENAAGTVENKAVDPLGIREAFNASGSAPVFACRAWVNFNGTGTVAIRASGNVSSITDNGVGDYTVNFAQAMPDADYSAIVSGHSLVGGPITGITSSGASNLATGSLRVSTTETASGATDFANVFVAIFR